MLIDTMYFGRGAIILRDVDGSEQQITLSQSLDVLDWLTKNKAEILQRIQEQEANRQEPSISPEFQAQLDSLLHEDD